MSSITIPTSPARKPRTTLFIGAGLGIALTIAAIAIWNSLSAPLALSWRQSLLDPRGQVLQLANTTDHYLSCVIRATNRIKNQKTTHTFSLAPREHTELGTLEMDWSFKSGEQVTIETEGFSTIRTRVP